MKEAYRLTYPFSAIIGQEKMKLALLLNAVNPRIGGVLIRGEKGTAKSTAARALASLLPEMEYIEGCPFFCSPDNTDLMCPACRENLRSGIRPSISRRKVPVVDLPLSATEDMVLGSIDFEFAIREGRRRFRPGILALANRGILYIDEVNLLDDHLVDIILDAAESGVNVVEREGISFWHPARFILVGTMNPEEGELRPQLLDRFGLSVQIEGEKDVEKRIELIKRRESYDFYPDEFIRHYLKADGETARHILSAKDHLSYMAMPPHLRTYISEICLNSNVAGHRADIVIERTALTIAALEGRFEVTGEDIRQAASLVLPHRQREAAPPPPPPPPPQPKEDQQREEEQKEEESSGTEPEKREGHEDSGDRDFPREEFPQEVSDPSGGETAEREKGEVSEKVFAVGSTFRVKPIASDKDRTLRRGSGKRSRTRTAQKQGRYVKSTLQRKNNDLALDATLRAAAPYQKVREKADGLAVSIKEEDIREKLRERRIGNFILFVVDASGSMGAQNRMEAAKGAIMSLLLDAYQKRDRASFIAFRKEKAEVLLPPTNSIELAAKLLKDLPVGGRTPLSDALVKTDQILHSHFLKEPTARPLVILITDGKANVALGDQKPYLEAMEFAHRLSLEERAKYIVVDTEDQGIISFGLAQRIADALGAEYFKIENLKARELSALCSKLL